MFTGLIQDVGVVQSISSGGMTDVWIRTAFPIADLTLGESIACDGVCLTVVEKGNSAFRVQASPETLRRTTLGGWRAGTRINLERAMRLSDRLGGHLVLGHVDQVAGIIQRRSDADAIHMAFEMPLQLAPLFIEKGSVAVDGVSLTVNEVRADSFGVSIIPETQQRTALASKLPGTKVNIETDLIGKYVARLHGLRSSSVLSEESLLAAGFGLTTALRGQGG